MHGDNLKASFEANYLNIQLYNLQGEQILSQKHKFKGGKVAGFIHIADSLNAGDYLLIAYANTANTESLNSVFSKSIKLFNPNEQTAIIEMSIIDTVYTKGGIIKGTIELRNNKGLRYANVDVDISLVQLDKIISTTEINSGESGIAPFSIEIAELAPNKALYLTASSINSVLESQKTILIPLVETPPDIQFLPESGSFLANNENVIAFKAINAAGNPFSFEANLINQQGEII